MNHSGCGGDSQAVCREEVHWVVAHHGVFQMVYYAHHLSKDERRERYRDHLITGCVRFCKRWDRFLRPDYPTPSLEHFAPKVRAIISPDRIQRPD